MTLGDLQQIETALGLALQSRYRELIQAYPLVSHDDNSRIELLDDASAVIAFNRFLRDNFTEEWLPHFFAFGNSAVGDVYFFDLAEEADAVYLWDHETHETAVESPDFDHWVAEQREG
jgi:hypothetical protein